MDKIINLKLTEDQAIFFEQFLTDYLEDRKEELHRSVYEQAQIGFIVRLRTKVHKSLAKAKTV